MIQILVAPKITDPSVELAKNRDAEANESRTESKCCLSIIGMVMQALISLDEPLLPESQTSSGEQLSLKQLLSNTSTRGPTILCATIMCLQQFSGVNAVMFYSTPVLRPLLPGSAGVLGIGITLVNAIMTLPAIFLVDVSQTQTRRRLCLG